LDFEDADRDSEEEEIKVETVTKPPLFLRSMVDSVEEGT